MDRGYLEGSMKVGDLVKWTNPGAEGVGVIKALRPDYPPFSAVHIVWLDAPHLSGAYPAEHKFLELLNESR